MYQHTRRKSKDWRHAPLDGNTTPAIEHFHEGNIVLHERSPPTTRHVNTRAAPRLRPRHLRDGVFKRKTQILHRKQDSVTLAFRGRRPRAEHDLNNNTYLI